MEIFRGGRSLMWLEIVLLLWFPYVYTVESQIGFLSIDCGSDVSYTDNETGIFWHTDDGFISTGTNVKITDVHSDYGPLLDSGQVGTLRLFDDSNSLHCYSLPVISQETYLVRGTFFYGNLGTGSSPISFNILMDNTYVYSIQFDEAILLSETYDFEVIYSPTVNTLNVCLSREQGPSFISALELRQLANGMYADVVGSNQYLYLYSRVNCGPPDAGPVTIWRYPDDPYDRVWSVAGSADNATHMSNPNISGSSNSFAQDPDRPPLVVMQTGWVYYESDILWIEYSFTSPLGLAYTAAYFQELDGNASASNVRGMNYMLNGDFIESFNSSNQPKEVYAIHNITDTVFNLSLVQTNWSHLQPILNAYELYGVFEYGTSSRTARQDVLAVYSLANRFSLQYVDVQDPCFPNPLSWLSCSDDLPLRVIKLLLENRGLAGNIPPEIFNLTALTYLDLNGNNLNGSIPVKLSGLADLQTM
ncbi:unnamed protein product [Calypogeia fissa]